MHETPQHGRCIGCTLLRTNELRTRALVGLLFLLVCAFLGPLISLEAVPWARMLRLQRDVAILMKCGCVRVA